MSTGKRAFRIGFTMAAVCFLSIAAASARDTIPVPAGNRNAEQPDVPGGSARRTKALNTSYEAKFRRIYALFERDVDLREKIAETAHQYGIDPLHIVGAIVGEHTYNVDAYDRLQTYYVKAISYVNSSFAFEYQGESVGAFLERVEFERCAEKSGSYELWTCREDVWNNIFRGKTVDGKFFPDDRFSAVFFQPFYAGQTFGIGQLNPLTALQMSDIVTKISGLPPLNHNDPQRVYNTIMDPDLTLPYVAATLRRAINAYREIAGFDISGNPGITATLYNLGNPDERALNLKNENRRRMSEGLALRLPQENYYGWLVNAKLEQLEQLFPERTAKTP